ncbi:hypothetical protein V5N11_019386 [Cardamine amara subsp. amara]|uniref:Reverse transcriptase domain-containing protein n=1 Tax=Cardamine amara subsp. amara TaxID=228776 RepID=A0ABD1AL83_CARAN
MRVVDNVPLDDSLPEEQLLAIQLFDSIYETYKRLKGFMGLSERLPWYVDIVNYLACEKEPPSLDSYQKKKFFKDVTRFFWDEPYLYKLCKDNIYRRCVAEEEVQGILEHCHGLSYGGHFEGFKTVAKALQAGFLVANYVQGRPRLRREM